MVSLEEYLISVNPAYGVHAQTLEENGIEGVDDLQNCEDGDYDVLGVPMFHWRKIMKKIKEDFKDEEPEPEPEPILEPAPQPVPFDYTPAGPGPGSQSRNQMTEVNRVNTQEQLKNKLKKFYSLYNPAKAEDDETIDSILMEYHGRYEEMWRHLEQKYILGAKKVKRRAKLDTKPATRTDAILQGIAQLYRENIRELEAKFNFADFHSPLMDDVDFMAKPQVLLVGQYSVGKTSFIRYLLERDFPGARIGPEPTTDSFMAVMHGESERTVPGNAAVMDRQFPFRTLQRFGIQFLNKFSVSQLPSPILESITFMDTPGILSGEKQRLGRQYDFGSVVEQFAYRADRILLLFDAHKLDISDEFRNAILMLKGHDDKVRCVLNKCDQIGNQALLRVYGALMWYLGKVFLTPEVLRVYVGSFWDQPYQDDHNAELFDAESVDLLSDLKGLPRHRATRKINEFVKRTRQFKVHLLTVDHLRGQFGMFGKDKTQRRLLNTMDQEFRIISEKNGLTLADFPNPQKFAQIIANYDIKKFPKMKKQFIQTIDGVLHQEVPRLMNLLGSPDENNTGGGVASNPFAENMDAEAILDPTKRWVVTNAQKKTYDNEFYRLQLQGGKASGAQVRNIMMQAGLGTEILAAVWDLSDITQTGSLDAEEFALCKWLLDYINEGNSLPGGLTVNMCPPGKRNMLEFS